jgi:predicted amidohydrolase
MNVMPVTVLQLTSVDHVDENMQQIEQLLESAPIPPQGHWVCLPENALYMRVVEGQAVPFFQSTDPVFQRLQKLAEKYQCRFHVGSLPLESQGLAANTSVVVTRNQVLPSYQKIHLFNIQLLGQKPIRESDVFQAGSQPSVIEDRGWSFGQTICYDMRFAELFVEYAHHPVDVILVPSAFLVATGKAHWEVLLRARAIESQCYVVAAAQSGSHRGFRETYGHSVIIDPWGRILAESKKVGPDILQCELHLDEVRRVRTQIPMADHRRLFEKKRKASILPIGE